MKEFIEFIVKKLVDNPDQVSVEETRPDEHTIDFKLKVDKSDIGKVIGKQGKTITSIRILLRSIGGKEQHRTTLEIVE